MWRAVREEGVGIWRGLPPRLMWVAPLSSVMFVYYELVRTVTKVAHGRHLWRRDTDRVIMTGVSLATVMLGRPP